MKNLLLVSLLLILCSCSPERVDGPNVSETTNGYVAITAVDTTNTLIHDGTVIAVPGNYNSLEDEESLQVKGTLTNGVCTLSLPENKTYAILISDTINKVYSYYDSLVTNVKKVVSLSDTLYRPGSLHIRSNLLKPGSKSSIIGTPFNASTLNDTVLEYPSLPAGKYKELTLYEDVDSEENIVATTVSIFSNALTTIDTNITKAAFQTVLGDGTFNSVTQATIDNNNNTWIGTSTGGVFHFDNKKWKKYAIGYSNPAVTHSASGPNGEFLIATNQGIFAFENEQFIIQDVNGETFNPHCKGITITHKETYFLFKDSLLIKQGENWQIVKGSFTDANALLVSSTGTIWIGTEGEGLFSLKATDTTQFLHSNSALLSDSINFIVEGKDEIWIGTNGGLNAIDESNNWQSYSKESHNKILHNDIIAGHFSSDTIWFISGNLYLIGFDGEIWTTLWGVELFGQAFYMTSISSGSDGELWIGSNGGGVLRLPF